MEIVQIIFIFLSALRLCNMVMYEDGPFEIFERIRQYANIENGTLYETEKYNLLGNILICYYCTSIYTSAFAAALYYFDLNIVNIVFASSQIVIFIIEYIEGQKSNDYS